MGINSVTDANGTIKCPFINESLPSCAIRNVPDANMFGLVISGGFEKREEMKRAWILQKGVLRSIYFFITITKIKPHPVGARGRSTACDNDARTLSL
jgi:hypothetical protein